jgi:amidase
MELPLHWQTVESLGSLLRRGTCSPREVVEAALARIEDLQPRLRPFTRVDAPGARAAAARAETELRSGTDRGPLHGVPIAIKELCDVRGLPAAAGTAVLRERAAEEDACVVARLRDAGAVILGTLAMTEGAYISHHPTVSPPLNPWNAGRWPGISSSGSGVATAAGLCYASLGSDTGGSIRFPSAANGIVGIKPTYGRVPRHGVFPLSASLDHVGPMTRSVRDAAAVLQVIAGFDRRDPASLRAAVPDYLADIDAGVRGVRIGVDEAYSREGLDAEIVAPILGSTAIFANAGAEIRPLRLPRSENVFQAWVTICCAEVAAAHVGLFPERRAEYGPDLAGAIDAGRAMPALDYAQALETKLRFACEMEELFSDVDLLLCPTIGVPVPESTPNWGDPEASAALARFTMPFDLSGHPTLSLPCGMASDGMPISLQLVGRHREEGLLCRAGRSFERESGWKDRHPPV